jgi:hypothetical protein
MSDRIGHAPVLLFSSGHAPQRPLEELNVSNRILHLLMRSCRIAEAIEIEQRRAAPSALRLLRLKRLRLMLVHRLQGMLTMLASSSEPHVAWVPARVPAQTRPEARLG